MPGLTGTFAPERGEVVYVDEDYVYLRGVTPGEILVAESLVNPYDGMEVRLLENH